jgi:1-pyrroline-4-hydroxy-2-carboxylate deaminase
MKVNWKGVFPALTTQFKPDQALDLPATAKHLETLIQAGIHGVVLLGTVGENTALAYEEKLSVLCEMRKTAAGRIPVLAGAAEYTTALACRYARDAENGRVDGLAGDGLQIGRSRDPHAFPHGGALHRIAHHDLQQPGLLQRRRAG